MTEDSKRNLEEVDPAALATPDNSVRARNRTVMLTANITEDLRSRLGRDDGSAPSEAGQRDELQQFSGANDWESVLKNHDAHSQTAITLGAELPISSYSAVRPAQREDSIDSNGGVKGFEHVAESEADLIELAYNADFAPREPDNAGDSRIIRRDVSTAGYNFDETGIGLNMNSQFENLEPDNLHLENFESPHVIANAPRPDAVYWTEERELIGFLVSYDYNANGTYVELRKGRLVISREVDRLSDCFVIDNESVGVLHAIVRIEDSQNIKILDQLSEFGTRVIRRSEPGAAASEICLSGEKLDLRNGDILCFGDRRFHLCLIPKEND